MFPQIVNPVLTWLHIYSAVGWMGAAMFFVILMGPLLSQLSSSTRAELILGLFPLLTRYVTVFATLTIVFGIVLAYGASKSLDDLSPNNPYGLSITLGALVALAAFSVVHGMVLPCARRMARTLRSAQQAPEKASPADLSRMQRRMRIGSTTVLLLLALALVFMVAAGSP